MGSFSKLKKIISNNDRFTIICHERPDGDAIGSLLALGKALEQAGKNVTYVCKDAIPKVYGFLKITGIKKDFLIGDTDAIFLVDNGDLNRTGFPERIALAKSKNIPIINIDHHPKNDLWKYASVNLVDDEASSASELVYMLLGSLELPLTKEISTYLLTGLHNDTGGFRHANTTPKVLAMVSDLLKRGAQLKNISDNIASNHSISTMKLWGIALNRLQYDIQRKISYSVITKKDFLKAKASMDEVSGLVNLLNSVPESNFTLLLYETEDGKIKGSLRTEKDNVNLTKLASALNGGGHKKASGFSLSGEIVLSDGKWLIK